MTLEIWLPPLVRAVTTAMLVVSASALAEAIGPFCGALIASLPVSAGPAYVFLAMQHNADFLAASALTSSAANAATGLFLIVYGILAPRMTPWPGLALAVLVWLAASVPMQQAPWTPVMALLLNVGVYGVGLKLLNTIRGTQTPSSDLVLRRWYDLPGRALAVGAFVTLVVGVSSLLGAAATGIAAVFPMSLISLFVVLRLRIGGPGSSLLAADLLRSMLGFEIMLLVLHLTIPPFGVVTAFAASLLCTASWSLALLIMRPAEAKLSPASAGDRRRKI